jgi:hypothetical protein
LSRPGASTPKASASRRRLPERCRQRADRTFRPAGLLKENRLGIPVEARTDIDEVDLLGDGLQFAFIA